MIINIDAATYTGRIQIGKQGENLTTDVVFDCNAWLDGLDGGTLSIVHQRNSDPDAYPCGDYTTDGKVLTWNVNETDLAYCGLGQCELRYTIGERIAKTKTFVTQTMKALDPGETPPEAWEPYIDRVIDAATQEMENMTVSASATSGEQTSVSVTKTRVDDHENLDFYFVVEKGDKGDPGQDGQDGKSIVNATASIDANVGTPSVTVTTSSSDAGLTVYLAFHNMKGIPGTSFDTSYLPSDTASGSPATFPDGAKNVPVDELVTTIVPQQDLHGYSKPWPGGGGKNVLKTDGLTLGYPSSTAYSNTTQRTFTVGTYVKGLTINNYFNDRTTSVSVSENSVKFTTAAKAYGVSIPLTGLTVGETYTVSATKTGGNIGLSWYASDGTYISSKISSASNNYCTDTVPNGAFYCVIVFNAQADNVEAVFTDILLEKSGSPTSYEPYANICPITGTTQAEIAHNGDTDPIPFGQTVYGGELNVTTGVLTIDKVFWTANSSTMNNSEQYPGWIVQGKTIYGYIGSVNGVVDNTILNVGTVVAAKTTNNDWDTVWMPVSEYGLTQTEWIALAVDVQVVFSMVNPTTVQLTPDEVRTVLGSNSISSNCGVVSVRYRADIGLYIDKKLS